MGLLGRNAEVVEAFRKSDWIDFSFGILPKGLSRANIAKVRETIPEAGFHQTLGDLGFRYHGWDLLKHARVLSIYRW